MVLYKELSGITSHPSILKALTAVKPPTPKPTPAAQHPPGTCGTHVTPRAMTEFLCSLLEMFPELAKKFAVSLFSAADVMTGDQLHSLWIPVFQDLVALPARPAATTGAGTTNSILTSLPWRSTFLVMLPRYVSKFVGPAPAKPNSAGRLLRCGCKDCSVVNRFLADPEEVLRFPAGKPRRHHLHIMLDCHRDDCTHTTDRYKYP